MLHIFSKIYFLNTTLFIIRHCTFHFPYILAELLFFLQTCFASEAVNYSQKKAPTCLTGSWINLPWSLLIFSKEEGTIKLNSCFFFQIRTFENLLFGTNYSRVDFFKGCLPQNLLSLLLNTLSHLISYFFRNLHLVHVKPFLGQRLVFWKSELRIKSLQLRDRLYQSRLDV